MTKDLRGGKTIYQRGKPFFFVISAILILFSLTLSIYAVADLGNGNSSGSSSDNTLNNNVENNIDAENADVDNSIENSINSDEVGDIDNNVTNDINVSVDVNVANSISNHVGSNDTNGDDENSNDNNNGDDKRSDNRNENDNGDDNGNGDDNDNGENGNNQIPDTVWGMDSASPTTENMLACVTENFGNPSVWGRYLGDNEGVSVGLTTEEVDLLQSNDIQTLVIWNHTTDITGYDHGQSEANEAIEMAQDLGIPEDVALFANVEPIYPVDAAFLLGWHDTLMDSEYDSGVYGIFDPSEELYVAFEEAAEENSDLLDEMYVWTASPKHRNYDRRQCTCVRS
ncbi:glycoside hydrolase domain-containing protein [Shouchella shacheensis]|uniref:glycoside hydrolase domain-containing protein n=1 Tax=Shouchella shacheensis TaxID=1649580 RepID=UPI001FE00BEF|nr:glycoside hydrolase domain-containing protein [Shouchella shacheensis]